MEDLDLKELFNILWNEKLQIILITAIFVVIGIIYTVGFVTPEYTASTTLILSTADKGEKADTTNSITTTDITLNSKLVSTYSEIVKRKSVLKQVIENLGLTNLNEEDLKNNVKVSSVKNTELIEISVTNKNANYAEKLANEIAKVFTQKVTDIYNINNVYIMDVAEVPQAPSNINHKKDVMMFSLVGVVVAIMYVLVSNMLDTTIKTAEDVEKNIKIPVLATIPEYNIGERKPKKKGGRR